MFSYTVVLFTLHAADLTLYFTPTKLFLSNCSRMFSETLRSAVVVEYSFLKPDCLSFRMRFP